MRSDIVALVQQRAQAATKRVVVPVAFGFIALIFFCITLVALFVAFFLWLAPMYGLPGAALIVAGLALVLGFIALLPALIRRQPPPPPPNPTLTQFASLVTQNAPALGAKQTALAAFLLAAAFGLMTRGSKK
jgi:hypothetical protein